MEDFPFDDIRLTECPIIPSEEACKGCPELLAAQVLMNNYQERLQLLVDQALRGETSLPVGALGERYEPDGSTTTVPLTDEERSAQGARSVGEDIELTDQAIRALLANAANTQAGCGGAARLSKVVEAPNGKAVILEATLCHHLKT